MWTLAMLQGVLVLLLVGLAHAELSARLSVIMDKQASRESRGHHVRLALSVSKGRLLCSEWSGSATHKESWGQWLDLGSPKPKLMSNPSTTHDRGNLTRVFTMATDGQVYTLKQQKGKSGCASLKGAWSLLAGKLPSRPAEVKGFSGKDTVTALLSKLDSKVHVFARTYDNPSHLFEATVDGETVSSWTDLGGDLLSDVSVTENAYTDRLEAYGIFTDGRIHRIWQWTHGTWSGWISMSYGQPSLVTTSRPVAHHMSGSVFNGRTEVFALGTDGYIHHCYQTTCDMVNNAWGLCTWSWWFKIKEKVPTLISNVNSLSTGQNIHGGNEVFAVANDFSVWHIWQTKRGSKWGVWEKIGKPANHLGSLPLVSDDLWWGIHFIDKDHRKVITVSQSRSLVLYPWEVSYGGVAAMSWNVPPDENSPSDWIGVFPAGANNNNYLDYRYLNGELYPGGKPVPNGQTGMTLFLPAGKYDVRYLVSGAGVSVLQKELVSNSSSQRPAWEQVIRGLNRGLGDEIPGRVDCVEDGDEMVNNFEMAFNAFLKSEFHNGLNLLGHAVHTLFTAFIDCGQSKLTYKVLGFAADLMACTMDACVKLAINIAEEAVILYNARYEIYWDIRAAMNGFRHGAYEQGAMSIGRLIRDSLGLSHINPIKDIVVDNLIAEGLTKMIEHI